MPTTNSATGTNARRNPASALQSAARSNSGSNSRSSNSNGETPKFKGRDPSLTVVVLGGDKLQGTNLAAQLPQKGGELDNQYNGDIEKALLQGSDIIIDKPKDVQTLTAEFNKMYYPQGKPVKSTDEDNHKIYMDSLQGEINRARKKYEERVTFYEANKRRIRNIALRSEVSCLIHRLPAS